MSRRSTLVAAGIAAFLVCLVAMVPASQLASRLPAGVVMAGVGGTIWSGRARDLAFNGRTIGAIAVVLPALAPVSARMVLPRDAAAPLAARYRGTVQGDFAGDEIIGHDLAGQVPITAFEGLATPRGWTGLLELELETLRLADRRPADAAGTLILRSLRAPGSGGQILGDFELAIGEGAVGTGSLNGRLRDLGGPLRVRGAIELDPDGRYLLSGEAAPGPDAGPAIFDTLAFLGPPDSQGRRPFTIEGSL